MNYGTFRSAVSDAAHTPERIDGVVYLLCLMPAHLKPSALEHAEGALGHILCGGASLFEWVDWICQGHGALAERLRENCWPGPHRFAAETCAVFAFQMAAACGDTDSFAEWQDRNGDAMIATDFGVGAHLNGSWFRNLGQGMSVGVVPFARGTEGGFGWKVQYATLPKRGVSWYLPPHVLGREPALEVRA